MEMLTQLLLLLQAFVLFNKQVTGFGAPVENRLAFVGNRPTGIWTSALLQLHTLLTVSPMALQACREKKSTNAAPQQVLSLTVPQLTAEKHWEL